MPFCVWMSAFGLLLPTLTMPGVAGAQSLRPSPGSLADGIAAVIEADDADPDLTLILISDVVLRARLRLASERHTATVGLPHHALRRALRETLNERLIAIEAVRLGKDAPSANQMKMERARLAESVGGQTRWRKLLRIWGVPSTEVRSLVRIRATAADFLEANVRGSTSISDEELERVFEQGDHPFQSSEFEQVRDALRAWLARRALEEGVQRWVRVLEERTPARILAPWAKTMNSTTPAHKPSDE